MQIPEPQPEHNPRPRWLLPGVLGVLAIGGAIVLSNRPTSAPPPSPSGQFPVSQAAHSAQDPATVAHLREGRNLALKICASCHLFPEPRILDRVTWAMEVLPDMALWLGLRINDREPYDALGLDDRVRQATVIPEQPPITIEQWRSICLYYLHEAPDVPAPQPAADEISPGLSGFKVEVPKQKGNPQTTMVQIDPEQKRIYLGSIGDQFSGMLSVFSGEGVHERSMPVSSPPVALSVQKTQLMTTLIGPYGPSDELLGQVISIPRPDTPAASGGELLVNQPRSTMAISADMNGDGLIDIVLCGYGHVLGKLSWFENKGSGQYKEQVLLDQGGALAARALDWNRDGRLDLIVMVAQQREGIHLLTNLGNGDFEPRTIVEKHPAWGFASFDLADMNGDGHLDIITANGDNGDFTGHIPPLKNYHGYRIYLNDGEYHFVEAWSQPVNGAFKVLARDFDNDGDNDLATTSFYADYENSPEEGFILFENTGGETLEFQPHTFKEVSIGRWITLDADDLDADGDIDIVLGSMASGPATAPQEMRRKWTEEGPPFVILRNTLNAD